jgi:hypothetical protein
VAIYTKMSYRQTSKVMIFRGMELQIRLLVYTDLVIWQHHKQAFKASIETSTRIIRQVTTSSQCIILKTIPHLHI